MKTLIVSGMVLLLMAPAAGAQESDRAHVGPRIGDREVTLSGSGQSDDDFDTTTLGVSGSYGVYTSPHLVLGVRQSINYFGADNADDALNGSTRGFVDYVFGTGHLRPYLGANLGAVYGDNIDESVAFGPELGMKYFAGGGNTFIFGQVEYQILVSDSSDIDDNLDDGVFNYTLGVGFNF